MTPHIPPVAIVQRVQERQITAKIALLKVHPYCSGCGRAVVAMAGRDNSASLITDRLACADCVKRVKADRIAERSGEKPNRDSRSQRQQKRKLQLLATDPHCTACRNELTGVSCVVAQHLFCQRCVGQVRQRPRKVQLQIIEDMKRKRTAAVD